MSAQAGLRGLVGVARLLQLHDLPDLRVHPVRQRRGLELPLEVLLFEEQVAVQRELVREPRLDARNTLEVEVTNDSQISCFLELGVWPLPFAKNILNRNDAENII